MTKKLLVFSLALSLFLAPALALAGVYQACDINPETGKCQEGTEQNVYYEGLVPCGEEVWVGVSLDDNGDAILDTNGIPTTGEKKDFPCQFCHIFAMVDNIVKFVLIQIVPLVAVAMFVVAGIIFFTAGGKPARVTQAKKLFEGVVIGLVIIYAAWLIVTFILNIIGVAEWTGLQSGWYKIDCPIHYPEVYVAPEPGPEPGGYWEPCDPNDEDCTVCTGEKVSYTFLLKDSVFNASSSPCPDGEIAKRGRCLPGPCDKPNASDQTTDEYGYWDPATPRRWNCTFFKSGNYVGTRSVSGRIFHYCVPEEEPSTP